jgi:hypothetical protein
MAAETLAIRLPPGMTLRAWLAERRLDGPPTPEQREAMEALAHDLALRGPGTRRTDAEDAIELRFDDCTITVLAEGARIVRRPDVKQMLGGRRDWYAETFMTGHGLVVYDPSVDLALAPPGVDVGPEPHRPKPQRKPFWRR